MYRKQVVFKNKKVVDYIDSFPKGIRSNKIEECVLEKINKDQQPITKNDAIKLIKEYLRE